MILCISLKYKPRNKKKKKSHLSFWIWTCLLFFYYYYSTIRLVNGWIDYVSRTKVGRKEREILWSNRKSELAPALVFLRAFVFHTRQSGPGPNCERRWLCKHIDFIRRLVSGDTQRSSRLQWHLYFCFRVSTGHFPGFLGSESLRPCKSEALRKSHKSAPIGSR